ncbi:MAG TPA: signal recognition particle-docking protein FtsY, partial [Rhodobacteraceae bacterium]|nr:signal recognition particle-docking protein FtsY [Paracoccaceae bacterium]
MSLFGKLKERLFKSSTKIDEGLTALVDEGASKAPPETSPEILPETSPE